MIPSLLPSLSFEEIMCVFKYLLHTNNDDCIGDLKKEFLNYIHSDGGIFTNSGLSALSLALRSMDLKKGDKIILPAYGCESVGRAVLDLGFKPVFVDVDEYSYNISLDHLAENVDSDIKAAIVIHMFGNPCSMDGIMDIASDYNIKVIEDSAQTIGSLYNGKRTGTLGDFGFYSFGPTKPMTSMGGGFLVSQDEKLLSDSFDYQRSFLYEKNQDLKTIGKLLLYYSFQFGLIRSSVYSLILNHRESRRYIYKDHYFERSDFEYSFSKLQSMIGLVQLSKLDKINNLRVNNAKQYVDMLSGNEHIHCPKVVHDSQPVFLRFPISIEGADSCRRDEIVHILKENGVDSSPAYPNTLPSFFNSFTGSCNNAQKLANSTITLPVHPGVTTKDINKMCMLLEDIIR